MSTLQRVHNTDSTDMINNNCFKHQIYNSKSPLPSPYRLFCQHFYGSNHTHVSDGIQSIVNNYANNNPIENELESININSKIPLSQFIIDIYTQCKIKYNWTIDEFMQTSKFLSSLPTSTKVFNLIKTNLIQYSKQHMSKPINITNMLSQKRISFYMNTIHEYIRKISIQLQLDVIFIPNNTNFINNNYFHKHGIEFDTFCNEKHLESQQNGIHRTLKDFIKDNPYQRYIILIIGNSNKVENDTIFIYKPLKYNSIPPQICDYTQLPFIYNTKQYILPQFKLEEQKAVCLSFHKHTNAERVYLFTSSSSIMRVFKHNINNVLSLFCADNRDNEMDISIDNNMEFKDERFNTFMNVYFSDLELIKIGGNHVKHINWPKFEYDKIQSEYKQLYQSECFDNKNDAHNVSIIGVNYNFSARQIWKKSCVSNNNKTYVSLNDIFASIIYEFKYLTYYDHTTPSINDIQPFFEYISGDKYMHITQFDTFYIWFESMTNIINDLSEISKPSKSILSALFYDKSTTKQLLQSKCIGTFILRLDALPNILHITYKNSRCNIDVITLKRVSESMYVIIHKDRNKTDSIFNIIDNEKRLQYIYSPNKIVPKIYMHHKFNVSAPFPLMLQSKTEQTDDDIDEISNINYNYKNKCVLKKSVSCNNLSLRNQNSIKSKFNQKIINKVPLISTMTSIDSAKDLIHSYKYSKTTKLMTKYTNENNIKNKKCLNYLRVTQSTTPTIELNDSYDKESFAFEYVSENEIETDSLRVQIVDLLQHKLQKGIIEYGRGNNKNKKYKSNQRKGGDKNSNNNNRKSNGNNQNNNNNNENNNNSNGYNGGSEDNDDDKNNDKNNRKISEDSDDEDEEDEKKEGEETDRFFQLLKNIQNIDDVSLSVLSDFSPKIICKIADGISKLNGEMQKVKRHILDINNISENNTVNNAPKEPKTPKTPKKLKRPKTPKTPRTPKTPKNKKKKKTKLMSKQNMTLNYYSPLTPKTIYQIGREFTESKIPMRMLENINNENIFDFMIKSLSINKKNCVCLKNRNDNIKIFDLGLHDKNNPKQSLYFVFKWQAPETNRDYEWFLSEIMNNKEIVTKYKKPLTNNYGLPKAINISNAHEMKEIEQQIIESKDKIINKTNWHKIPIYWKKDKKYNKRRMKLSLTKEEFMSSFKQFDINNIQLIQIIMFGGNDIYWNEYIWLLNIHENVDIGIAFKYKNKSNNILEISGIHLDKELMIQQHQITSPAHECHHFDTFGSCVNDMHIGNPDDNKNRLKTLQVEYNKLKDENKELEDRLNYVQTVQFPQRSTSTDTHISINTLPLTLDTITEPTTSRINEYQSNSPSMSSTNFMCISPPPININTTSLQINDIDSDLLPPIPSNNQQH